MFNPFFESVRRQNFERNFHFSFHLQVINVKNVQALNSDNLLINFFEDEPFEISLPLIYAMQYFIVLINSLFIHILFTWEKFICKFLPTELNMISYVIPKSSKFQKNAGWILTTTKNTYIFSGEILSTFYTLEITVSLILSQWLTKFSKKYICNLCFWNNLCTIIVCSANQTKQSVVTFLFNRMNLSIMLLSQVVK